MTKLVARETKNRQLFAILIRQGIQLNEVPDGGSSHSSDVIYEHDYKFHKHRNPIKYNNFIVPKQEIINYNFFNNAERVVCLSKLHHDIFRDNLGLKNLHNTTCSLWSEEDMSFMESLIGTPKNNKCAIVNSPNPIKRTKDCVEYCKENNLEFDVTCACTSRPNINSHSFFFPLSRLFI